MAKTKKQKQAKQPANLDGVYLLKLVFYALIGTLWLKMGNGSSVSLGLPIGLIIGVAFTAHEHFQIDRKIEYAVLVIAMLVGYFAPFGLYISY